MIRTVTVAWALACLTFAPSAAAQSSAAAETLFRDARADMKANRFADACPKLAESHRLDPSVGTLLNLATCEEKLGRLASAWARFSEVVDLAPRGDARAKTAIARRDALAPRLPRFRLTGTVPPKATVELDGVAMTALGVSVPIDPGRHTVRVRRDGDEKSAAFEINEGQALDVVLPIPDERAPAPPQVAVAPGPHASAQPAPAPPAPPATPPSGGRSRTPGYALAGIGAVGVVVSVTAGALAMSKKSTVADHCRAGTCDAEGASAASDGRRFVALANVAGVVGVVGLGAAGWWFATSTESAGERRAVLGYAGKLP